MLRRELLLGSAAVPALYAQKKAPPASPNILLIVAEDVGAWMLGCYGTKEIRTPNLDLLARGGTRFANHFASTPSPAPSRATLFTGRLPGEHGIQDSPPPEQATPSFQNALTISD